MKFQISNSNWEAFNTDYVQNDMTRLINGNCSNGKIYIGDNRERYVLGEIGRGNLFCIGVNPSTADTEKDDQTISVVRNAAKNNGYDGWIMLNLYPERQKEIDNLSKVPDKTLIHRNEIIVKSLLKYYSDAPVWAAWGSNIEKRGYLKECFFGFSEIFKGRVWLSCAGSFRHPHHPLYVKTDKLIRFDIDSYCQSLM